MFYFGFNTRVAYPPLLARPLLISYPYFSIFVQTLVQPVCLDLTSL